MIGISRTNRVLVDQDKVQKAYKTYKAYATEFSCLVALREILPVPEVMSTDETTLEIVMKRFPGEDLRASFARYPLTMQLEMLRDLGAYIRHLHDARIDSELSPVEYALLFNKLEDIPQMFRPIKDILRYGLDRYLELVKDRKTTPTHGDLQDKNIIVHEGRITGIVDWEYAELGFASKELTLENIFCYGRFERSFALSLQEAILEGYQYKDRTQFYRSVPLFRLFDLSMAIAHSSDWAETISQQDAEYMRETAKCLWKQILGQ